MGGTTFMGDWTIVKKSRKRRWEDRDRESGWLDWGLKTRPRKKARHLPDWIDSRIPRNESIQWGLWTACSNPIITTSIFIIIRLSKITSIKGQWQQSLDNNQLIITTWTIRKSNISRAITIGKKLTMINCSYWSLSSGSMSFPQRCVLLSVSNALLYFPHIF